MDDTQQSRVSDASAATRKRRSSILKSQRPPRAPLSELEFHVATPTDTSKSRRVSFSRRTGVAEFVTNEATTTWKNFYEEHNKTLESSGNESEANPRPSVGQLGKRIFDQQFQEVELFDFTSNMAPNRPETSLNNVDFGNLEGNTGKLNPPQQHFEFSAFTEHSKMFSDDLAISGVGEVSGKINMNFSEMQPMGDDLDEIQKDLERHKAQNQAGPRNDNVSEYIEVDLNTTHAALHQSDMSITDTIQSPKVNVSKTNSLQLDKSDKCMNKDWEVDKENIAINPYAAPNESDNFAINEEEDKVLVFDGKRLTVQSQNEPISDYRKTLLPNLQPEKTPNRKTIVLNIDDDLPNFVENPHASMSQHCRNFSMHSKTVLDDSDLSMTQPLPAKLDSNASKSKTIHYEDIADDISMTRAVAANIISAKPEKRRTIVFENDAADISVTKAVTSNLIFEDKPTAYSEKRRTIVFDDNTADISVTQAIPSNLVLPGHVTQSEKRKTIVFDDGGADISVTQAVPSNLVFGNKPQSDKRRTIVFDEESADISVTQAVPSNLVFEENPAHFKKRNTIVFDSDDADISVTQAVASNLVFEAKPVIQTEKRRTIVFDEQSADVSVTRAVPSNLIFEEKPIAQPEKRKTIVFDEDSADISITQAIPTNLVLEVKRKTIVFDEENANISVTQAIPANLLIQEKPAEPEKRKTIVFSNENADVSITQVVSVNLVFNETDSVPKSTEMRNAIDINAADISFTQTIPSNLVIPPNCQPNSAENETMEKQQTIAGNDVVTQTFSFISLPTKTSTETSQLFSDFDVARKDSSNKIITATDNQYINRDVSPNLVLPEKDLAKPSSLEKTLSQTDADMTYVAEIEEVDMSVTQAIPSNVDTRKELTQDDTEKREKLAINNENADISVNRTLAANQSKYDPITETDNNISFTQIAPEEMTKNPEKPLKRTPFNVPVPTLSPNLILSEFEKSKIIFENECLFNEDDQATIEEIEDRIPLVVNVPRVSHSGIDSLATISLKDLRNISQSASNITLQQVPSMIYNTSPDKNQTINDLDKSITQKVTTNLDDDSVNVSKALKSTNLNQQQSPNKNKTSVYSKIAADISVMEASPTNRGANENRKSVRLDGKCATLYDTISTKIVQNHPNTSVYRSNVTVPQSVVTNVLLTDAQSYSTKSDVQKCERPSIPSSDTTQKGEEDLKEAVTEFDLKTSAEEGNAVKNPLNSQELANFRKDIFDMSSAGNLSQGACQFIDVMVYQTAAETDRKLSQTGLSGDEGSGSSGCTLLKSQESCCSHVTETCTEVDSKSSLQTVSKAEQKSENYSILDSESAVSRIQKTIQKSLLDDLLDMGEAQDCHVGSPKLERQPSVTSKKGIKDTNSKETMFYIVDESDKSDSPNLKSPARNSETSRRHSPVQIQYEACFEELQEKLLKIQKKSESNETKKSGTKNRRFEKVVSGVDADNLADVSDAETTRDLLELLSQFTNQEEAKSPIESIAGDRFVERDPRDCDNKSIERAEIAAVPQKRPNPKRMSVVLSHEDIMNNISMAKAMLQKSIGTDDDEPSDIDLIETDKLKKSMRMSPEVVKTLRFEDDESAGETQNKFEAELSTPLRKSFGEPKEVRKSDNKGHVIPRFWQDVSESIKAVMNDLVKPMPASLPYDACGGRRVNANGSNNSINIQTNLVTSSQVDLDPDNNKQMFKSPKKLKGIMKSSEHHSMSGTLSEDSFAAGLEWKDADQTGQPSEQNKVVWKEEKRPIITFDPGNPLRNVLLGPIDFNDAHKYEPVHHATIECTEPENAENSDGKDQNSPSVCFKDIEQETKKRVSSNFNVPLIIVPNFVNQSDHSHLKIDRPICAIHVTDHCVETENNTKDVIINTDIIMRENSKLLQDDSSLTLVELSTEDEEENPPKSAASSETTATPNTALLNKVSVPKNETPKSVPVQSPKKLNQQSPIQVIYEETEEKESVKETTLIKSKKRKQFKKHIASSPVKPAPKVAKLLHSTTDTEDNLQKSSFSTQSSVETKHPITPRNPKTPKSPKNPKSKKAKLPLKPRKSATPQKALTVQHMTVDFHVDEEVVQNQFLDAPSEDDSILLPKKNLESVSSVRSELESLSAKSDTSRYKGLPMDWQPELLNDLSSKNLLTDCDSSIDVIAKIDNIPFMGGRDLEWETRTETRWSFRLLRGRVRAVLALAPPPPAAFGRARANTPVLGVTVEPAEKECRNAIANLCVRFAVESIRQVSQCARAADVPALLRRAGGAARVAGRWGRAMHDAWLHLAYTVTNDGQLTLKVANIPLRSVWEVSMQIVMSSESGEGGGPRATDVRVTSVLSDLHIEPEEVKRVVERVRQDWGHVPCTLWKIFKYLKHKTRDDLPVKL